MCSKVNFPSECLEDIFRHLNGKDLLKCTLVSPNWNNFIGSTILCMRKISFNYHLYTRKSASNFLKDSRRSYYCLKTQWCGFNELQDIATTRPWIRINFKRFACSNELQHYLDFMQKIQLSIEVMRLANGEFNEVPDVPKSLSLGLQFP